MSKFTGKVASVILTVTTAATLSGFGSFVAVAGAATTAELQAQIAALLSQIAALQAQLNVGATACSFTRDLTVGSQGTDVTCLQTYLTGTGHFTFAGGATGYFGAITKAAVAAWQAANGVSSTGYFGPLSRAKYTAVAGTSTGTGTGTGTGTTTTTGKSGKEGTATVTLAASPASGQTLPENDKDQPIYGIDVEAVGSEIYLERVKLQFNTLIYRVINWIGMYRDGKLIAQMNVNSSTVNKESSTSYTMQLTGFSERVEAAAKNRFEFRVNAEPVIESSYITSNFTVLVPANGARLTDGAGINIFEPTAALSSRSIDVQDSDADTATVTVSLAGSTPDQHYEIANSNGEASKVTLLIVNVKAQKDTVKITDLVASIDTGDTNAVAGTPGAVYLYDGEKLVDSASLTAVADDNDTVTFDDFELIVDKDTTKPITLKMDYTTINDGVASTIATMAAASMTIEASDGDALVDTSKTGSATGNRIYLSKRGPLFALISATAVKSVGVSGVSSSTGTGTIKFTVTAQGGDLYVSNSDTLVMRWFKDGTASGTDATTTGRYDSYTVSGATLSSGNYTIAQGTTATIEAAITVSSTAWGTDNNGNYDFRLIGFQWNGASSVSTTFLDDLSANPFKTNFIYLP